MYPLKRNGIFFKNYETLAVANWLTHNPAIYEIAIECRLEGYRSFVDSVTCGDAFNIDFQTTGGVSLNDPGLDIEVLDSWLLQLKSDF